ncbi:flagellar basal body rod protein FlgG [Sinobaca sp. H24]|uniref:flagellar basal body rod protein FlgG n=1 Tax=Sinobaca sp. H24 TaxID=2923376 RepID=UPI00207A3602|nr:flagellar basal body rod protein FlgG [Sinobaca sp. H24]
MIKSMYSSIAGMKNFQQKLDVTSNNIANVNTFGFKKGRATFQDMVSQQMGAAQGAANGQGGINGKQVGSGSKVGSIDTVHTQGSLQNTGRQLDLGISGEGFFQVNNGQEDLYTRSGNFYLDEGGTLVNAEGMILQAQGGGAINIPADAQSFSISTDGAVNITNAAGQQQNVGQIGLTTFNNPEGLEKAGGSTYRATDNSGAGAQDIPGADGRGDLISGTLEMSNVDLADEFTEMIVAQRGFQANTRGITTADEILQELMSLKR